MHAAPSDEPLAEGWLWKRSRHVRVWRRRHALLLPSGWLGLYREASSGARQQPILRASFSLSAEWQIERMPKAHHSLHAFLLHGPGVRVCLACDDDAEAARWILLIGAQCRDVLREPPSPLLMARPDATLAHRRLWHGVHARSYPCCESSPTASWPSPPSPRSSRKQCRLARLRRAGIQAVQVVPQLRVPPR